MTVVILIIFINLKDSALYIDSKSVYLSALQNGMFQIDAAVNDNDIIFITYDSISFCFS